MNFKTLNDQKPEVVTYLAGNASTTAIVAGNPVCLSLNGTDDGHDVEELCNSAATQSHSFFVGIAVAGIPAKGRAEVTVSGFARGVNILSGTRAASTGTWATQAAIALGDVLILQTVGDALTRSTAGAATVANARAVAMASRASIASGASTTSETGLRRITTMNVWLRSM